MIVTLLSAGTPPPAPHWVPKTCVYHVFPSTRVPVIKFWFINQAQEEINTVTNDDLE